jgi:hypothetical protein
VLAVQCRLKTPGTNLDGSGASVALGPFLWTTRGTKNMVAMNRNSIGIGCRRAQIKDVPNRPRHIPKKTVSAFPFGWGCSFV